MSKAVKSAVKVFVGTFVVVTGLAALGVAFGVGTLTTFFGAKIVEIAAMSAVSVLVGGLLSKGVDATAENFGTKVSTRSATNPRQIIYGKARVGGTITHIETSGTDKYKLSMIVVLAGHEVESLEEVLINDEVLTTTSNGGYEYATNTRFTNSDNDNKFSVQNSLLRYVFLDGSQTTANNNVISNTSLGNTDKFIGISYIFVEMVFDSEAFGGGIPPMSFVVKGKKVFDPRDSTTAWSDNPALCVRDYITDTTYGLKATSSEVNDSTALGSFKVAANTCEGNQPITTATVSGAVTTSRIVNLAIADTVTLIDVGQKVTGTGISGNVYVSKRTGTQLTLTANVSLANGTTLTFTEMAYTANGITNMSADGGGVIEGLLSSCAGKLSYIDGKFVMFAGANVTPNMTITDDNLLAPITVQTAQSSGETFNSVKAVYVDANNNYVATDSPLYEDSTLLANDTPSGESSANYKKSLEIQLPFTDTTTMAQRLQRTALLHTRQKTSLSVSCNIAFMQLQPFDWVYLTNERLGYTNKTFEVLSTNLEVIDQDGVPVLATRLDLKEINSSVYNFASSSYTNPLDEGSSVSTGSFAVSPPTSLAVATTLEITGFDLNVSWTNNPDDLVQGTEVFYGTTSGTYIGSFIVGKSTAKESINGVKASTTYYVAVRHFSSNNVFSALTSEVSVTTGTAPISYSTGGGNVGGADTLNVLGKNLVLNDFNSTTGGDNSANYTFLNSGNGALGGVTSYQNSDTERIQFEFGEDPDGDWGKDFFTFDFDWGLAKGGADGNSMGVGKFHIKGRAADNGDGNDWLENTIATFEVKNADGNVTTPVVTLANTTITGSTTTPIVEVSQGSAPSTTTNKLYNIGGSLYWNGAVVDTGAGDITGVTITTSGQSGLTGGASFASGDATFTLAIAGTISGSKTFSDDVVVEGDLTVEGTTTTIDTTNLDVKDKNITLNYGSGDTSANANGAGITIQDAVSASQNATILWNTSANAFKFSHKIRLDDNIQAQFGNGADLQIYHNGITSNSNIENYTGGLYITNYADDQDIIFRSDDDSGGVATYFQLDGSQGQLKVHKNMVFFDNVKATFGDSADLQIYHDSTDSYIDDAGSGDLRIRSNFLKIEKYTGETMATFNDDNAVTLYYNNSPKIATTNTGIDITGSTTTDGITSSQTINVNTASGSVDARLAFNNSVKNGWIGIPAWDNTSLRIYGTSPTTGNTNEPAAMYRDGAWSFWTDYNNTSGNGSTSTAVFISTGGSLNVGRGDIQIGGTTVISSSRNLLNIGTISINDYISHNGDSNTYFGFDSADTFSLVTGGTTAISADANATYLRYQGSAKLATTSQGINVTSLIQAEKIQLNASGSDNPQIQLNNNDFATFDWLVSQGDNGKFAVTVSGTSGAEMELSSDGSDYTNAILTVGGQKVLTQTAGINLTGNLGFNDNVKALFGTNHDLQIYHDGSNSYLTDNGTGNLYLTTNGNKVIIGDTSGERGIEIVKDGEVLLKHNNNNKLATTSSGIDVTGTVTSSGRISTTNGLFQANEGNQKFRQYEVSSGSGTQTFLLGKIENSGNADGGVTGTVKAAYDYGDTVNNCNIHFTFAQRSGVARGHWWYENTDDDASTDVISVRLVDDGSGGMFVWLYVGDYVNCFVEAVWRQCSSVTDSGTLSAGTITTGTTLFDTADNPTSEHHIGKLKAHDDIDVTGTVTADEIKVGASDRIYLDGGSNTFIQESASDDLRFFVGGQQAVRVRTSGTDILGTVVSDGLTVNSGTTNQVATFSSTDATAFIKVADNSTTATGHGYGANGNDLSLYANDSEKVRILSSGHVNIKVGGLRIGGTTVIDSSRNLINIASISVAPDTNVASTFGRAKFSSLVNDYMYLSHIDHASTTNYALNQNSAGATSINAPSGQSVALKINNVAKITLNSSGNANFAGDVSVTSELSVGQLITASGGITTDQTGQTISGFSTIRVGDALIGQDVATLTTTATTQTNRILASATTYRTIKVLVQIKSGTNFHATEILLTHNGTTVYMTEYATIFSNSSLATFDADISGGNIRLLIDPNQSASTEFKFNVSGIEA